ncbi:MAG: redoxin domain-containing protein [Pseudomonadota bacterium]
MSSNKPVAGAPLPAMKIAKLGGGEIALGGPRENWTFLVVYRGKHCPKCKSYLNKLETKKSAWEEAGFDLAVVSADPEEKAAADVAEFGWTFDLGYGLSEDQMKDLGVYISDPLSAAETDRRFAEPGHFIVRPDGNLQLVDISNGPASRPDLDVLLDGIIFTIENNRPPRGTAV